MKNSYIRPRADIGTGDECWPMRPPGAVITRACMNTCEKQLLCHDCARLARSAATPKAALASSVAVWRVHAQCGVVRVPGSSASTLFGRTI